MKVHKGEAGYIRARKKKLAFQTACSFALVAALIITGYLLNHTKLNLLTLVAILGCLPACRMLVNLIMMLGHQSINEATELEISGCTDQLTTAYDMIITSERRAMPIDAVVISRNTVCGYTRNSKVDTAYAARHIKAILRQNKLEKVTVKIFHDYVAFLSRAEGMNNIAAVEKADRQTEEEIREIILDISL